MFHRSTHVDLLDFLLRHGNTISRISHEAACNFATVSSTVRSNPCFITGGSSIITLPTEAISVSGASLLSRTSERTYLPASLLAIVSAAGVARRDDTHATLPPWWASVSPPPPTVCQSLAVGGPCGAGYRGSWPRCTAYGNLGSCTGGLGMFGPLLLLDPPT